MPSLDPSSQKLLQKDIVPFEEEIEPWNEKCNAAWGMSTQNQWNACKAMHVLLFAWVVVFAMDLVPSDTWPGYAVNNLFPIFVFGALCIPMCVSMVGFMPHMVAFIMLLFNIGVPFLMIHVQAGLPFLFAYVSGIIMTFMYLAIHLGGASNQHDIGDWGSVLQVNAIATISALLYLMQWNPHLPMNYKLRWVICAIGYWKDGLIGAMQECRGKRAPYDSGTYRTYFLNDVQFVRVFFARVSIMLALFSMTRMLEEKVCPPGEVHIEGAVITWGNFSWHPHNFTKTIPICAF